MMPSIRFILPLRDQSALLRSCIARKTVQPYMSALLPHRERQENVCKKTRPDINQNRFVNICFADVTLAGLPQNTLNFRGVTMLQSAVGHSSLPLTLSSTLRMLSLRRDKFLLNFTIKQHHPVSGAVLQTVPLSQRHYIFWRYKSTLPTSPQFKILGYDRNSLPMSLPQCTSLRYKSNKRTDPVVEGLPELNEDELEEKAVLGSGPGGQHVQKTHNACQLKHIPTGVTVKSHYTRSFEQNRQRARLILRQKLDQHYNRNESLQAQAHKASIVKRAKKHKRSQERQQRVRAFKEREGLK